MTKKELLVILDQVSDDFEITLDHNTEANYWENRFKITGLLDIAFSDKKVVLDIEVI